MRKLSIVNQNPNEEIADKKQIQYSPMLQGAQQTPLKAQEGVFPSIRPEAIQNQPDFGLFQPA